MKTTKLKKSFQIKSVLFSEHKAVKFSTVAPATESFVKKEGYKEGLQTQMPKGIRQDIRVVGTGECRHPLLVRSIQLLPKDLLSKTRTSFLPFSEKKSGFYCKSPSFKISANNSKFLNTSKSK